MEKFCRRTRSAPVTSGGRPARSAPSPKKDPVAVDMASKASREGGGPHRIDLLAALFTAGENAEGAAAAGRAQTLASVAVTRARRQAAPPKKTDVGSVAVTKETPGG